MKVIFSSDVFKRLRLYVLSVDTEISFLGKVERNGEILFVSDLVLLKQTVSHTNTVLDQEALGQFYTGIMERGEDPSPW